MITLAHCRTGIALAALLATGAVYANTMTKTEFNAAKGRIEATAKADNAACKESSGNAADVCRERASGKEKVARAELDYRHTGKVGDRDKLAVVTADAAYATAKEGCDDRAGQAKDVCIAEAKATHTKALADAKLNRQVGAARSDAADEKRAANYKLAAEKCDSLAGDAKASCVVDAKARFGKS